MSVILALLTLAASPEAVGVLEAPAAPSFGFERVDLVAELPGTFVNDDLPELAVDPVTIAVRFVEQVQVVFRVPVAGLTVGASLAAQCVYYAVPIPGVRGLELQLGLQSRLLLPVGFSASVGWRIWRVRVGLGVVAATTASWDNLNYDHPYVLPTLALGIGQLFEP
jgi:hypothetical protein